MKKKIRGGKMTSIISSNLYDLLEISPRASKEVILAAYEVLTEKYAPGTSGKNTDNDRILKNLDSAKEILLDPAKRKDYDHDRMNLKGKIIGNYSVLEQIAEGGFGKTYKGEHTRLHTPVCIKHAHHVSPQDEDILMQEASTIWDLRHYGIPTMRDIHKLDDGSMALVMSYIPGPTLEQIIKKNKKLDPEHVAWITARTLNVLKYLHYHGVVHGDVKPQNIIIQPESHHIVLVDYGLSIIRPSADSGAIGYTPYFASPEQARGDTLLPESDFYSLGITMIYALGGDIAKRHVPDSVPDAMCNFIKRLIVYDVMSRPNWNKEDLVDTMQDLRIKSFGRKNSGMKPLPGV